MVHLVGGDDEELLDVLGELDAGPEADTDAEVHELELEERRGVGQLADVLGGRAALQAQPLQLRHLQEQSAVAVSSRQN